jgi:pimeloyl-ACP methyl ester carboxylesterase
MTYSAQWRAGNGRVVNAGFKVWFGLVALFVVCVSPAYATLEEDIAFWSSFENLGDAVDPDSGLALNNGLPIGSFYNTPSPLPLAAPGTLIRADSTPFSGYTGNALYGFISVLPEGVSAYRFVYHSRSTTGQPVASSGVIFVPPGPVPPGGWPVIAWAHGTAGVARSCAPSAMKDVFYGDTGLYGFLNSLYTSLTGTVFPSYAVVATDYTGLGTNYPHEYLSRFAQGLDVIYSIPAAHAALPGVLSKKWVTVGHSQGGEAALAVAELQSLFKDKNYLGAVSVAPLTDLVGTLQQVSTGVAGYLPLVAHGVKSVFPAMNYNDIFTQTAWDRLETIETVSGAPLLPPAADPSARLSCLYVATAAFGDLTLNDVYQTGPGKGVDNVYIKAFSLLNQPGIVKANRPILVAQGNDDEVIPPALTGQAVNKMCGKGSTVEYKTYDSIPGVIAASHVGSVYLSFDDQMNWIGDRFAGLPAPSNCH